MLIISLLIETLIEMRHVVQISVCARFLMSGHGKCSPSQLGGPSLPLKFYVYKELPHIACRVGRLHNASYVMLSCVQDLAAGVVALWNCMDE